MLSRCFYVVLYILFVSFSRPKSINTSNIDIGTSTNTLLSKITKKDVLYKNDNTKVVSINCGMSSTITFAIIIGFSLTSHLYKTSPYINPSIKAITVMRGLIETAEGLAIIIAKISPSDDIIAAGTGPNK